MTSVPKPTNPAVLRSEIQADAATTVLDAAARRLVRAYDDYEDALDRRVSLGELQLFDQEVARAESAHASVLSAQGRT